MARRAPSDKAGIPRTRVAASQPTLATFRCDRGHTAAKLHETTERAAQAAMRAASKEPAEAGPSPEGSMDTRAPASMRLLLSYSCARRSILLSKPRARLGDVLRCGWPSTRCLEVRLQRCDKRGDNTLPGCSRDGARPLWRLCGTPGGPQRRTARIRRSHSYTRHTSSHGGPSVHDAAGQPRPQPWKAADITGKLPADAGRRDRSVARGPSRGADRTTGAPVNPRRAAPSTILPFSRRSQPHRCRHPCGSR